MSLAKEVPPALLMETLELREELAEARAAGDDARVQAMASAMRARVEAAMHAVASGLRIGRPGARRRRAGGAALLPRFMDEVALHDDAVAEGAAPTAEMRGS